MQTKSVTGVVALGLVGALALTACAKDGDSTGSGGASSNSLVVASDLPLQGAGATQWQDTNKLIQLFIEQSGGKAGNYPVTLKSTTTPRPRRADGTTRHAPRMPPTTSRTRLRSR